jgi:hypothetical protein
MKQSDDPSLHERTEGPSVLLRSSWQPVNIGDVSHTPGLLALLERYVPDARITLWSNIEDPEENAALKTRFPGLQIVHGTLAEDGAASGPDLGRALDECEFLLHGSGPAVVARRDLETWRRAFGKPYGIYGVTIDPLNGFVDAAGRPANTATLDEQRAMIEGLPSNHLDPYLRSILEGAQFVFCRDSLSLAYLRRQRVDGPATGFAPDAAFGIDIRDDARAGAFMERHGLEDGRFLCVVPRLRYTPYHRMAGRPPTEDDRQREAISDRFREEDFNKLREAIAGFVEATGLQVALVPEMTYQIDVAREMIYDRLPPPVRERTVLRTVYWLPYEACALYARSAALLSMDNHSPIFALAMGVPTVFLRHATDTIKGWMWRDVGLGDWFFEMDNADGPTIRDRLLAIVRDPASAAERVRTIMARVRSAQAESMTTVGRALRGIGSSVTS